MRSYNVKSNVLTKYDQGKDRSYNVISDTRSKNEGGILGGIGYVAGKTLTGIASVGEGIGDLVAGGIAELSGDHRKATYIFGHSEVGEWNKALDDWYNPDGVMEVVGEIGGAVGNSLAFAGATAAGTAVGAPWLGYAVIGASGVGGGVGEAVQETGRLGAREYIFGTLAGATELGLEAFTGATIKAGTRLAGKGASKVGTSVIGKKLLPSTARRGFIRTAVTEASEEFIEEFASTYANVHWRHVTGVDPDAEYSFGDATYAGLIGFVSGGLMSGGSQGVQNAFNASRGARIVENGNEQTMLNTAQYVIGKFGSDTAVKSKQKVTDALAALTNSYEAYGKLKDKSGMRAKLYLGEMQQASARLEARARAMYASEEFSEKAKADPKEAEHYAKVLNAVLQPDTAFTAEDIVNNKELSKGTSVCDMLGYMKFAGEFMDESRRKAEYAEAMQEAENAAEVVSEGSTDAEMPSVATDAGAEAPPVDGPSNPAVQSVTETPAAPTNAPTVAQSAEGVSAEPSTPANTQETQNLPSSDGSAPETVSTPDAQASVAPAAQSGEGTSEQSPETANAQEKEHSAPTAQSGEGTSEQSPETANAQEKENSAPAAEAVTRTNDEKAQVTEKAPTAESAERAGATQGEGMDAVATELRAGIAKAREEREAAEAERAAKKAAKKQTSEKTSAKDGKRGAAQFSISSGTITAETSDSARYGILKDRALSLSAKVDTKKMEDAKSKFQVTENQLELLRYGEKVRLFKKIGEEFSVYRKYNNRDVKLNFAFSKENMRESVSKQRQRYARFAKMLTCLDSVIDNAIGIEVHNRNEIEYKTDRTLENVYVLASAFVDGQRIIPVKLEIKEFSDKENTLHIAIALESFEVTKKDGSIKKEDAENGVAQHFSVPSNISIANFFEKINPLDEDFLKYLPDNFLSAEQIEGKRRGITKEKAKIDKLKRGQAQFSIPVAEPGDTRKEIDRVLDDVTLYMQTKKESNLYELDDDTYSVNVIKDEFSSDMAEEELGDSEIVTEADERADAFEQSIEGREEKTGGVQNGTSAMEESAYEKKRNTAWSKAREYVQDFDLYPAEVRENVLEMIVSADGIKEVDAATVQGLSDIIASNIDLRIRFESGLKVDGLHYVARDGRRMILVNPSHAIEYTQTHELVHSIEGTEGYVQLASIVERTTKEEERAAIIRRYELFYMMMSGADLTWQSSDAEIAQAKAALSDKKRQNIESLAKREAVAGHRAISVNLVNYQHKQVDRMEEYLESDFCPQKANEKDSEQKLTNF